MKYTTTTSVATLEAECCPSAVSPTSPASSSPPMPPCATCKTLRRRCAERCMLAPYFPPNEPLVMARRVFGASNIIKLLQKRNPVRRKEKVVIGGGAGFAGDRPAAALKLLQRVKELDYLVLECLAERTLTERYGDAKSAARVTILAELGEDQREDAVNSMVYEANARLRDPVYGCADSISYLQKQVNELQVELSKAHAQILNMQCQNANLLDGFIEFD